MLSSPISHRLHIWRKINRVASLFLPVTNEAIMPHIGSTLSFLWFTDFPWSLYPILEKLFSFLSLDPPTLLSKTSE
jgi:hypothetical protein